MNQDLFVASVIPWLRDQAGEVARFIHSMSIPNDARPPKDMFRPAQVQNATTQQLVPAAAERLLRWDRAHPNDIFSKGFMPRESPAPGKLMDEAFSLRQHVTSNVPSIFVGTVRYYRNAGNKQVRWRPLSDGRRFKYEVFAYGGIDVNAVLGDKHRSADRREIAFPGGIRPEFIRAAREYNDTGRLVRIWENPRFNNTLNPAGHVVPLVDLPSPIRSLSVPVIFFTARDGATDLDSGRAAAEDDLMRVDGLADADEDLDMSLAPRLSTASVLRPDNSGRAYYMYGNRYVQVNAAPDGADTLVSGPKDIASSWPSLVKAGFGSVDAILPDPRPDHKGVMYFFCMEKYARINIKAGTNGDYIVDGPKIITQEWPSLKRAGFTTIDAVLATPANNEQAYFFSGDNYVRVKVNPGTNDDTIVDGPRRIVDGWPSLASVGFKIVDEILPNPSNLEEAYVFSGEHYVRIKVNPGGVDTIVTGKRRVADFWPSLKQAGFY